jgi:hypothetical protein
MISRSHFGVHNRSRYVACLLAAATLVAASCSDVSMNSTGPTKVESSSTVSVNALSNSVIAEPVSRPLCPSVAPFNVPFGIVVRGNGVAGLVVTRIQMQFTDSAGAQMPPVTLAAPLPITQFGTALAASRDDQRFSLSMGVGCSVERRGSIMVEVETRDAQGRRGTGRVSVSVR